MADLQNIYKAAKEYDTTRLYCVMEKYCKEAEHNDLTLKLQVLLQNFIRARLTSEDLCNAVFMLLNDISFTHPINLDESLKGGHRAPQDTLQPNSPYNGH